MSKGNELIDNTSHDSKDKDKKYLNTAVGLSAAESARVSTQQAKAVFSKPDTYTGNRKLYDSGTAKKNVKRQSFSNGGQAKDPYTGKDLVLTKAEAKAMYGNNCQEYLAEGDHIVPIKKVFDKRKNDPWINNEDINSAVNNSDNMETVSRKYNNAKRDRSNPELVNDKDYMDKTGLELTEDSKKKAIETHKNAEKSINKRLNKSKLKNITKTGHKAGVVSAKNSGVTALTMSGIMNITAVINGEKTAEEAIGDTIIDGGKAAATGYIMGGGLTVVSHSLSNSSSKFVSALTQSSVPGKVITAVMLTGDTLKRYGNGEINTQECILELGEKGLNFATTGYSMAVGQALIPIPIVGAAIGALVGSTLTSQLYNQMVNSLQTKQLEHQERMRIIAECETLAKEAREFRLELESYLESYFKDYRDCFDTALSEIKTSLQSGDVDGVILSSNQITKKLGGNIHYETVDEFIDFLDDDLVVDIL